MEQQIHELHAVLLTNRRRHASFMGGRIDHGSNGSQGIHSRDWIGTWVHLASCKSEQHGLIRPASCGIQHENGALHVTFANLIMDVGSSTPHNGCGQ